MWWIHWWILVNSLRKFTSSKSSVFSEHQFFSSDKAEFARNSDFRFCFCRILVMQKSILLLQKEIQFFQNWILVFQNQILFSWDIIMIKYSLFPEQYSDISELCSVFQELNSDLSEWYSVFQKSNSDIWEWYSVFPELNSDFQESNSVLFGHHHDENILFSQNNILIYQNYVFPEPNSALSESFSMPT